MAPMSNAASIPRHLAIIMDGNGRWARERGLPRTAGHRKGLNAVERAIAASAELGIEFITLYAFSAENWKRPETEISALMELLGVFLQKKITTIQKNNIRLKTIGRTEQLPSVVRRRLLQTIQKTSRNKGITVTLALSYGGREEIVDATKKIASQVAQGSLSTDLIDHETIKANLYDPDLPDPDLLIRTSGEIRISNFLLWQLSYTEMVVFNKFWPDFEEEDIHKAVESFQLRHRRFGEIL